MHKTLHNIDFYMDLDGKFPQLCYDLDGLLTNFTASDRKYSAVIL